MIKLTLEKAKTLTYGTILYYKHNKNSDNTLQRWKVNGKVKLWKRSPNRISIPIKHSLFVYDYLTEHVINDFLIKE